MGCSSQSNIALSPATTKATPFHLVLLGPPGVGKGTQCDQLKKRADYEHISTGDLIRAEIRRESELGLQIKDITERGELVGDDIVCAMLAEHLRSIPADRSWVIDGFPRTAEQAKFLRSQEDIKITHIIALSGDEQEITERLSGRLYDPETGSTYHAANNPPPEDIAPRCITRKDD